MITPTWRNLHIYLLDAAVWSGIHAGITPYNKGIGLIGHDIPAEGTINVLVRIIRVQGSKERWYHRCTELTGDSVRRGVYHPHFGTSFSVDAAALKVQAVSDMHVLRSRTRNTHMPKV
jgi:hypothetical protein